MNEKGFVFLELLIGLPLILMLLWVMSGLFINTWQKCKFAVADFILYQEMQWAMERIVDDTKRAYNVKIDNDRLILTRHKLEDFNDFEDKDNDITQKNILKNNVTSVYFKSANKIYKGSNNDISSGIHNPITGGDDLSDTRVNKLEFKWVQKPYQSKLLKIELEAKSYISKHSIKLSTEVFIRGLQ